MSELAHSLRDWLVVQGAPEGLAHSLSWIALALFVAILAFVANYLAKRVLLVAVSYLVKKSETTWDDILLQRKVFTRLSHLAPALVIYFSAHQFPSIQDLLQRLSLVYMIASGLLVGFATLNAVVDIYRTFEVARHRPIKGYIQIVQILLTIFVVIVALAVLMNRSPWLLLSGFGAMTAILILVFKDSILGLIASIQLSQNDMVRIGDWIQMPKYGADGDVIDVSLHTVKVQNWDKTITTIPSYALISDSFKNWRGMNESGGRRIKRAIHIDIGSIKFCTNEMLARFEKYQMISDYLKQKRDEIGRYNRERNIDTSELINGRNLTNVGTFRAYVAAYLRSHPQVRQEMTFLVRQLPPDEHGLPIEIYVFCADQVWANYEAIQADIFDHILAVVPMFDLRVFQAPSGDDLRSAAAAVLGKVASR